LIIVITFYSDNNDGACTLSIERLAKFLSRSRTAINEALARLEDDQIIIIESGKKSGTTNKLTPWVHKAFGEIRDPLTWILDVRAPSARRSAVGRPAKIGVKPACHPQAGDNPADYPQEIGSKPASHPQEIGSKPDTEIGGKPTGHNTTYLNTTERGAPQSEREPPQAKPDAVRAQAIDPAQKPLNAQPKVMTAAEMAAATNPEAALAAAAVKIGKFGELEISSEFRDDLRKAFTESQIERGLERAPANMGSTRDPVKIICSYAKQDDDAAEKRRLGQSAAKSNKQIILRR
jgi:hypothetical protein